MKEYKREYPLFSLCGLNCGLCPRYQTNSASKCPGCGGQDFYLKHPSCAIITCNKKHDNVEYCFQCSSYPCDRYRKTSGTDSFITYLNVITDFQKNIKWGLESYEVELNEKVDILEYLLKNYDDGRRKSFYCLSVNVLTLADLKDITKDIEERTNKIDIEMKEKIELLIFLFEAKAKENQIELKLRK